MKIAVVILNWNGKNLLERFLPSVTLYSKEANIYVADNASTDGSVGFVREFYPAVGIIQNEMNGGYAKGYNDALKDLSEDIFILLNSDVEVSFKWLSPIIGEFLSNPETAAVQPKILDFRKRDHFEYAGAAGGYLDRLGYPFCRGRIFATVEKDLGQYNKDAEIFWASGACLAIRREAFFKAGGFDEDFFAHQEEIDLCWRLHNMGMKVKYLWRSSVFHLGGATLNSMDPRKTFYNFRNSLYTLAKNGPGGQIGILIVARLFLDGLAGLKYLLELKPSHTLAVIKAHFSFYTDLGKILGKRRNISPKTKYFLKPSVVYAYYILGKKKFTEL